MVTPPPSLSPYLYTLKCRKLMGYYSSRYPVTVSFMSDTNAFLNAPSITVCPTARLSCYRLASAILQEIPDDESSELTMNASLTQTPDTNKSTSTSRSVFDDGRQETPTTNTSVFILRQLLEVAQCCRTLHTLPRKDFIKLGCNSLIGVSNFLCVACTCIGFSS